MKGRDGAAVPTRVSGLDNVQVEQAVCGPSFTLALAHDGGLAGGLVAFGQNEMGQCGMGPGGSTQVDLPRVVRDLKGHHIVRAAAGGAHTLALSATGGVFSWGSPLYGQLGRDTSKGGWGHAKVRCSRGAGLRPCRRLGRTSPSHTSRLQAPRRRDPSAGCGRWAWCRWRQAKHTLQPF